MPGNSSYPPFLLPENIWWKGLASIILYFQQVDTVTGTTDNPLIESCHNINIADGFGKGVVSADIPAVLDFDPNANTTLLTVTKPVVAEQFITVSEYKKIPLTTNEVFSRLSFPSESSSAYFIGYLLQLMTASKRIFMYQELVKLIDRWTPTPYDDSKPISSGKRGQKIPKIEVTLYKKDKIPSTWNYQMVDEWNAKTINQVLLNTVIDMTTPNSDYNEQGMTEFISSSDLRLWVNSKFDTANLVDFNSYVFGADKTASKLIQDKIVIPERMLSVSPSNVIGWVGSKDKFQYGYKYELATNFYDGSTLNNNHWLHFAYYASSIDALPCVKIVAKFVDPPTESK